MARILVLDGHCNAALAFTRSLGRSGHWVAVGRVGGILAPATLSRYCRLSFEYPSSTAEQESFAEATLRFVRQNGIELVLPMTDWTTFPLVLRREQLRGLARLAAPSAEALELVSDKYSTIELARKLGVPVPETLLARSIPDLEAAREWTFPLVIKDRCSVRWFPDRAVFGSGSYVYSWDDLVAKVQEHIDSVGDVLVQKFVAGAGVGFSCLATGGNTYLPFEWERVRSENPLGGASSTRKSVPLDPRVLKFGTNLMVRSGFQGIGMVEFKRNRATGRLALMEINGRPWGSLQLAIESGVDYPRHVAAWLLQGVTPPEKIAYKKHITCRRFTGDLDHLLRLRHGKPANWPGEYPKLLPTLVKISIPWYPGLHYEDFYLRDARPGLAEMSHWIKLRVNRLKNTAAKTNATLSAKGILHCHTSLSYDGKVPLADLCAILRRKGFNFVALTEHTRGLKSEDYEKLAQDCRAVNDESLVVIPGLEFRCSDGPEIAGIGISQWFEAGTSEQTVARIRELGGFAIWVHPWRNGRWKGPFLDCDAAEVLNLKIDGSLAPNFGLLRSLVNERKSGRPFHATFGVDFHNLEQTFSAWVECHVLDIAPNEIVRSLREGQYVNRVPYGSVSSSGKVGILDYAVMGSLRTAFVLWRGFLRSAPLSVRTSLIAWSRPVVKFVRGDGTPKLKG